MKVYRVAGCEAISEPFRYVVDFLREDPDWPGRLASDAVLGRSATLEICVDDGGSDMARKVHGTIEEFVVDEYLPSVAAPAETLARYRAVLVPRVAMLARNRQNRIHATSDSQTLAEIIKNKLLSQGPDYSRDAGSTENGSEENASAGSEDPHDDNSRIVLAPDEFRIDIVDEHVPLASLSHVAQYNETDLDFIRRLCEWHGVYFFFSSTLDDDQGMVVFGNTNSPFGVIRFETDSDGQDVSSQTPSGDTTSQESATYQDRYKLDIELTMTGATGLVGGSVYTDADAQMNEPAELEGALYSFRSVHRPFPSRVRVIDDRESAPGQVLRRGTTLEDGEGIYTDYDTHFSTQTAGDDFARIRSQEIEAASHYFIGLTNSPCVAPGRIFKLKTSAQRRFLVTRVDVDVRQAHADLNSSLDADTNETGFSNRFRCVELKDGLVYRPPRVTPVPRLPGVHTAYIATGSEDSAMPDTNGAYRIYHKFADERDGVDIDRRSAAVHKAEPYAGHGVGMHFPLKKDTEVLVAYRNGDPDRPVIAGAMPDLLDHRSPVTSANPTSHVIETSSGARFEIDDGEVEREVGRVRSRVALRSRASVCDASYVRLGKADAGAGAGSACPGTGTLEEHYVEDVFSPGLEAQDGIALLTAGAIVEAAKQGKVTEARGAIHARSLEKHLLRGRRMVIFSGGEEEEPTDETNAGSGENPKTIGDDDMLLLSEGSIYINSRKDIHTTAQGTVTTDIGGAATYIYHNDLHTRAFADEHHMVSGTFNALTLGVDTSLVSGLVVTGSLGSYVELVTPLTAYLCFGVGAFMRPQLCLSHFVRWVETNEVMLVRNVPAIKESSAISITHQALSLRQCSLQTRIENWIADCVGISIEL